MPGPAATRASDTRANLSEAKAAISSYTRAVERRLRPGLDSAIAARDAAYAGLAEAEQMSSALDVLDAVASTPAEEGAMDEHGDPAPRLRTRVNVGEEFYADAEVTRLEPVVVEVGLGVLVEMTREEARVVVERRREAMEKEAEKQNQRIAAVQAHLKSVVKHLEELTVATAGSSFFSKRATEFRE